MSGSRLWSVSRIAICAGQVPILMSSSPPIWWWVPIAALLCLGAGTHIFNLIRPHDQR